MTISSDECARRLLDVVPRVMQRIRVEVRRQRGAELSVLQLRVLAFLRRNPGAPLSAVAEHVGLTLPSMSTQVTGLVARRLVERQTLATDRRFITLTLTDDGLAVMAAAADGARASLSELFDTLNPDDRNTIVNAMGLLEQIFSGETLAE
jgi:DNA-binding MarR family transcriptional regulator